MVIHIVQYFLRTCAFSRPIITGGSVTKANFGGLLHGFAADVPSHYVSALKDFSPDSPIEYIGITSFTFPPQLK